MSEAKQERKVVALPRVSTWGSAFLFQGIVYVASIA